MAAFILWAATGCAIIALGIYCFHAKKVMGFWANVPTEKVSDTHAYNRAVGKLWCGVGAAFILLGLPLLAASLLPLILVSLLGTAALVIAAMIVYSQVIEKKYCNK